MNCNYSEMDWYCCLPEGHDGEHRSRSEGHGDVNSEYLARMVCDVLAKRYDFMNNKHIRPDFEKEIFYALEQQRKYLTHRQQRSALFALPLLRCYWKLH